MNTTPHTFERLSFGGILRDGRLHAASMTDRTPAHVDYEGECSWCWFGYGHTAAAHDERIAARSR